RKGDSEQLYCQKNKPAIAVANNKDVFIILCPMRKDGGGMAANDFRNSPLQEPGWECRVSLLRPGGQHAGPLRIRLPALVRPPSPDGDSLPAPQPGRQSRP